MPDLLDPFVAQAFAKRLQVIDSFPWSKEAADAIAECLIRWCRGFIEGRRVWQPEDQAEWLIAETIARAADSGEKWEGVAQLRAIFRERFQAAVKTMVIEHQIYRTPKETLCTVCDDTGWEPYQINGNDYSKVCTACSARRRVPPVCGKCEGKGELLLADGRRLPCGCMTPKQREQVREFLKPALERAS